MFKAATDKTFNLLASGYAYPRGMITNFAKADDEATRTMFRNLFDESQDLAARVDAFQTASEEMRVKYDDGTQGLSATKNALFARFYKVNAGYLFADASKPLNRTGYAHIAFSAGDKEKVDELTEELRSTGYEVVSGPRTTGDGYYESCIVAIEGNQIEITE